MAYQLGWLRAPAYSTSFPLTENPISENSTWLNGAADGLDWQNVRTTPGKAFAVAASAGYDDCIACLKSTSGISSTSHYAQCTILKTAGYTAPDSHEVALFVGRNISAHSATGYEWNFQFESNTLLVRWNGNYADFDVLGPSGPGYIAADGDQPLVTYQIVGGNPVLTLSVGGVTKLSLTDTDAKKIVSGQPGLGFFARAGTGLDLTKYCMSSFTAGTL